MTIVATIISDQVLITNNTKRMSYVYYVKWWAMSVK